jgi:hypothetical protein
MIDDLATTSITWFSDAHIPGPRASKLVADPNSAAPKKLVMK